MFGALNVLLVVGIGQDITERIATENEYVRLIATANAPIFGVNADGLINIWYVAVAWDHGVSAYVCETGTTKLQPLPCILKMKSWAKTWSTCTLLRTIKTR